MNLTYQTNPDIADLGAQSYLFIVLAATSIFFRGGGGGDQHFLFICRGVMEEFAKNFPKLVQKGLNNYF